MRAITAAVILAWAMASSAAAQQPSQQDAFAQLALDYCAPVVAAGPDAIERIATEQGLTLGEWRGASDATGTFEQWVRESLRAQPDARIRAVFATGASDTAGAAAFVDEAGRSCLVTGRGVSSADASLLTRLRAPTTDWQFVMTVETNGGSIFEWPGPEDGASASLIHWSTQPGNVARVLINRRETRVRPLVSPEVVAAWVARVVDVCAAAVHERRDVAHDAFGPFLTFRERSDRGTDVFDSAPGQPAATISANGSSSECLITSTGAHGRAIDSAILALATERGLPASERPRRLRLPKFLIAAPEELRRGRDAYVSSGMIMGFLMATVGDATR